MAKSKFQIIADVEAFVFKHGGSFKEWYVGAAAEPRDKLFDVHKFQRKVDVGLIRTAPTWEQAREVVAFFVTSFGAKGDPGTVTESDVHVYAYKTAPHTHP
jgi:hypothetical protein